MGERWVVAEVPSGTIDLIHDGRNLRLQFNARCEDVLAVCKGQCCRMRPHWNTPLAPDEIGKWMSTTMPDRALPVLAYDTDTGSCHYQDHESGKCRTHDDLPRACTRWHCSPGGQGEGIEHRDHGWLLVPSLGNLDQEV